MKREFRLSQAKDIKRVRQSGKSYAHPLMVLVTLFNDQQKSRFGIIAGRSIGNAVERNRAKRLLRAALQPFLPVIAPGWDIMIIARHRMVDTTFKETQKALKILLQRAAMYQENA